MICLGVRIMVKSRVFGMDRIGWEIDFDKY